LPGAVGTIVPANNLLLFRFFFVYEQRRNDYPCL